jgi:pyruvate dehydrogenase (quinone)
MAHTAADVLVEGLIDWGVDIVFGIPVERPEEIRPALERALSSSRPTIVEVVVDPFEPPMPAKVSAEQALHLAEALAKGQPDGRKIALTIFRDKLSELL